MATVRGGYAVLPHVQAFADAVVQVVGLAEDAPGTYAGHDPTPEQALDIFVTLAQGDAVCEFALANWARFGLRYMIFYQRINSNDGRGWRQMADRGSPTQNHYDHVHLSFEDEAPEAFDDDQEDFFMALTDAEQRKLADQTAATNDEVGKLAVVIRDETSGLAVQVAKLTELVEKLSKSR